jgi:hypothetical protein
MPVTVQTPFHLQRRSLVNDRHLVDTAMTRRAPDAFVHVNRVIEVRKIRQVVNANPSQWLVFFQAVTHRLEIRTVGPNLFVAAHANRGRGNACRGRRLDRRVAVTAINAVIADVMFVTELDGLLTLDVLTGVPAGAIDLSRDPKRGY